MAQIPLPDLAGFRDAFPEFENVPDGVITASIDFVYELLKPAWRYLVSRPKLWTKFVYLYAAHTVYLRFQMTVDATALELGMNAPSSAVGTTNNVSASPGSLSKSIQQSQREWDQSHLTQDLIRTPYGIEILTMIENLMPLGEIGGFAPRLFNVV